MHGDPGEAGESVDLSGMAEVSNLAIKIRRFLEYIESMYLFLAFMLGFVAISQFSVGLSDLLDMQQDVLAPLGSILGIIVPAAVYLVYARRIFRITGNKYMGLFSSRKELATYNLLVFASWTIIVLLVEHVNPNAIDIVWYPGLVVMFITMYLVRRSRILIPHFIAALIMLPFTPVVIVGASQKLALGSMMMAYYFAGVYSLREALKVFERG